jgi:hypothetical protein
VFDYTLYIFISLYITSEEKPLVPCRRFDACKRSLNGVEKALFQQNYRIPFSTTVPTFPTRSAPVVGDVEASGGENWNI